MDAKIAVEKLKKEALEKLKDVVDERSLEAFRVAFLGRQGKLSRFLRGIAGLPPGERRAVGSAGNALRDLLGGAVKTKAAGFAAQAEKKSRQPFDVSRPGKRIARGHLHVLSRTLGHIQRIFAGMGFSAIDGPETESEYYNFDALNIPENHPARDMHDTFWLRSGKGEIKNPIRHPADKIQNLWPGLKLADPKKRFLLRTHTSPMQVRYMETHTPPFRIIVPGRVFRYDASDASHEIQFHQVEGLYVDRRVSVADFKSILGIFFNNFFGKETKMRLRPAYFPFVEPGFELIADCVLCGGRGCSVCGGSGQLELGGAGMVHQNVFVNAGYVRGEWTGFAFGIGAERFAMIKHKIPDIRLFFGGDLRFIEQF